MDVCVSFQNYQNIEFLLVRILSEFCEFCALRVFSPCCALTFEESTHYGAPHTPRKDIDVCVSFQNDQNIEFLLVRILCEFCAF